MTSHGYKKKEISQELSMGTKIFKTSYYTVLRALSFKKIKILIILPLYRILSTKWWVLYKGLFQIAHGKAQQWTIPQLTKILISTSLDKIPS